MRRFGATARKVTASSQPPRSSRRPLTGFHLWSKLVALSLAALCWGLINFGLLLWLPGDLQEKGYSVTVASTLLAKSALISFPTVFLCAFLYSRWSTKWSLVTMIAITMVGLGLVVHLEVAGRGSPVLPVSLLIVGSNGILAILLPYAAESFPLNVRGKATGWVAACTKAGGVGAQGLAITALVPSTGSAAIAIMLPTTLALALIARFGRETRGTDLRDLDVDSGPFGHGSVSRS